MWQVSRQSSAEYPSDMRQKRSTLGGTGVEALVEALAADTAASLTRFLITVFSESALILF
jgi:hypothetical protein